MDMEKTGNYIREKCELKRMTYEKLSEQIDVSPKAISNWVNAKSSIKLENAVKLAEVLEVTVPELILGKDMEYIDTKDMAEFDKSIKELTRVSFGLEDKSITAMEISSSAFGTSLVAVAMSMWAAFGDGWIAGIVCFLLGLFGIVFIIVGQKLVRIMNDKMEERKEKSSMS